MNTEEGNSQFRKFSNFLMILAFLFGGIFAFALRWFISPKKYPIRLGSLDGKPGELKDTDLAEADERIWRAEELKLDRVLEKFFGIHSKNEARNADEESKFDKVLHRFFGEGLES